MEINGLPAHVLLIHGAVVFVPLAAVVATVYAVVPSWRWATRWISVGLSLMALGAVLGAYFSGKDFADKFVAATGELPAGVALHEERAEVLLWVTVAFVAIVLAAAWGLGGPSALTSGWGARGKHDALIEWSLIGGVVVFALIVVTMTIQTGDAGAEAVWLDTWKALNE